MDYQVGVKFTFYRMGTSISRMTDFEDIQQAINLGLESVAMDCIKEVFNATGLDLDKLAHPYPVARFCFFSEISFNSNHETIAESKRMPVLHDKSKKREVVY
jgi:hypothetical protein